MQMCRALHHSSITNSPGVLFRFDLALCLIPFKFPSSRGDQSLLPTLKATLAKVTSLFSQAEPKNSSLLEKLASKDKQVCC